MFSLYFAITTIFFVPYFNWQYARENGFAEWFFLGEIRSTAKAFAWPYFLLSQSSTPSSHASWSPKEIANNKHFLTSIRADLQAKKLARGQVDTGLSMSEIHEIIALKKTALDEVLLVDPAILLKIHPDLPRHVGTEYIPMLEYAIRHLVALPKGDPEAMRKAIALSDVWADWWNANRDTIYLVE